MDKPDIIIINDFDGFFESWIKKLVDTKSKKGEQFNHKHISINSGPYRSYVVKYEKKGEILELDFYAAFRNGFGSISSEEINKLIELL